MDLAELRSLQDFFIKYACSRSTASPRWPAIGGYVRQYQIEVDPDELRYHDIPLSEVIDAVKRFEHRRGAKTVESGGMEFIVRGKGFIGSGKTEARRLNTSSRRSS
jgi:copper/silver efflux system protein